MLKSFSVVLTLVLMGCSSSSSSSPATGTDGGGAKSSGNIVNGTLGGQSLAVADGFFYPESPSTELDGGTLDGYQIMLTNYGGACDVFLGSADKAGSAYLKLKVRTHNGPVTAGTYSVASKDPGTSYAEAEIKVLDATCNDGKDEATGGTVTVTSVSGSEIAGTFSITSGSDTATGSFDVTSCISNDGGSTSGCVQ